MTDNHIAGFGSVCTLATLRWSFFSGAAFLAMIYPLFILIACNSEPMREHRKGTCLGHICHLKHRFVTIVQTMVTVGCVTPHVILTSCQQNTYLASERQKSGSHGERRGGRAEVGKQPAAHLLHRYPPYQLGALCLGKAFLCLSMKVRNRNRTVGGGEGAQAAAAACVAMAAQPVFCTCCWASGSACMSDARLVLSL